MKSTWIVSAAVSASLIGILGCTSAPPLPLVGDASLSFPKETRITNLRQLTFGGTNAEAYWSFDGRWLSYQHTGEDACDQIYRIGLDGTAKQRISSGQGRTTCAYYTPNNKWIVYSSTHATSKACPAEPDKSKGYLWPIYPSYQFYRATPDGKEITPMEPGAPSAYNGEMTLCKDGSAIFTSDRNGDLDLYTGKVDSKGMLSDIKQITNTLGYDGGAFFSEDCTKIVWRASRPKPGKEAQEYIEFLKQHLVKPTTLELWIADRDGSNAQQVTKLGAAAFAPYFTPDKSRILFSSNLNKPGGRNFDIFMIKTNGTELEQITHSGTFDSFPMFSPDGKYLAFSSNRNARKHRETNIFIADWNGYTNSTPLTMEDAMPANRFYATVRELSGNDMEGRGVTTAGLDKAEALVIDRFESLGLATTDKTLGHTDGVKGFEHPITIITGVDAEAKENSLKADWKSLKFKDDFAPANFSAEKKFNGELVDAGHGMFIPGKGIDEFNSKEIKGRMVLIRTGVPEGLKLTPQERTSYLDLRYKIFLARERGAAGVLFWNPEASDKEPENLLKSIQDSSVSVSGDSGLPALFISKKVALELSQSPNRVKISGSIKLKRKTKSISNLLGWIGDKSACRAKTPVVIGAHLDHLGYGGSTSLDAAVARVIHPGADDNASGIAALIEVARELKKNPGNNQCYLIAAFTAEEIGVVGSSKLVAWMTKHGIKPRAMLNMDMVGHLRNNTLIAFGADTASEWKGILDKRCGENALKCVGSGDGFGPSDHMPFYVAGVPVLHFFTGTHADYHRSTDTVETINATGGIQVAELVASIAKDVTKTLHFQKPATSKTSGGSGEEHAHSSGSATARIDNAYLGTIPDYAQMADPSNLNQTGVRLSGVREGSPGEQAGIKAGDRITGITLKSEGPTQGQPREIQSLQDYTLVLSELKPNDLIEIQIVRDGKALKLEAKVSKRR